MAKAVTAEEFGDWMLYARSQAGRMSLPAPLLWSFDNARTYNYWAGKCTCSQPWRGLERAPLPKKSPDIHKLMFGRFKHFFRQLVLREMAGVSQGRSLTCLRLMELCQDALLRASQPATLQQDLESLLVTLEIIARPKGERCAAQLNGHMRQLVGSGGDWPSVHRLR